MQSEIQKVAVDAEGGTYTLSRGTGSGSGTLNGATVTGALTEGSNKVKPASGGFSIGVSPGGALAVGEEIVGPGISEGEVVTITAISQFFGIVSELTLSASATETVDPVTLRAGSRELSSVTADTGSFSPGDSLSGPGIPAATTVAAVGIGTLTLSTVPSETGVRALVATQSTEPIAFDAEPAELEAALTALPSIGDAGGSVSVVGGPGDKGATKLYSISYGGSLAESDVVGLVADPTELSGGINGEALVFTALDGGPGTSEVVVYAQNVGGASSSVAAPTVFTIDLPEGVVTDGDPGGDGQYGEYWSCTPGAGQQEVSCETEEEEPGVFAVAEPGFTLAPVVVPVTAEPGATGGPVAIEVSGGGAFGTAVYDMPLIVSAIPALPGMQSVNAAAYDEAGTVDDRAGAHPYSASTGILVNTKRSARTGQVVPAGEFRDILVDTPPGFFGNPIATGQCPEALPSEECEQGSIVATAQIPLAKLAGQGGLPEPSSVNNVEAPVGYPGKFRFRTGQNQVVVNVVASLRSDEDYGLKVGSYDTPQIKPVFGAFFTFWGSPLDEGHDEQRCVEWFLGLDQYDPLKCVPADELKEAGFQETAFLTNPLDCGEEALRPPAATLNVNTWQNPGLVFSKSVPLKPVTGCDELDFEVEDFDFQPGSDDADSPASFTTELRMPTEGLLDPDKRMNPTIKQTVIDLPEGVVLNASAADGLKACSKNQIGLKGSSFPRPNEVRFDKNPDSCPNASKIGTGELESALIAEPLSAELFLAEQGEGNPFGSLFAIYLVIENPRNGIFIKLPGEVRVDEDDGQQRVIFRDLPPLPFTSLKLKLKGGARSPLASPPTCGDYETKATNTPWSAPESGPPLTTSSEFEIDEGPGGGDCADSPADRPFALGLSAGSVNPVAGAHTDFRIRVTRPDGHQEVDRLQISPPPGFVASLGGVPYCSEAQIAAARSRGSGQDEQDDPSCPAASGIGTTNAAAGSGPRPFYAPGELYLAGPYKGAPLSVVSITPAVAGPFDLGNVVVRSALRVDAVSARITAITDEIPRLLKGVPLRLRDLRINLDRPAWAQNPTSCQTMAVDVRGFGSNGAISDLSNRFQVGNCQALGFEPRTNIRLFGGIKRGKYQGVRAVVRPRPGDANISRTVVRFPKSAFVAQEHIRTVCTRVQFAADACPKGSIYGKAVAWSPLLDYPLRGNVYLRSSDNDLPDAVADLRGPAHQPLKVEVAIRNDSVGGALRNTVEAVPDAPVSYFRVQMFGGDKGLIVNSRNVCRGKNLATVTMGAHNGRRSLQRVPVFNKRCKKQRKAKRATRRAKAKAQVPSGRR